MLLNILPQKINKNKLVNKLYGIHTIDYYSAIKRNEQLVKAKTWVNRKIIMLSERSHTKRVYAILFYLHNF